MKKIFLLLSLLMLFISALYSQSFSLSDPNGSVQHNGVVGVLHPPSTEEMKAYIFVTNISTEPKALLVKKEEIFLVPGTSNSFCWNDLCYPPDVYVADNPITLGAGATTTSSDFYGTYSPELKPGTTKIRYTFFDADNINDSVSVVVHYIASAVGVGKLPLSQQVSISKPYPNPANANVSFNIVFQSQVMNAVITVRNLLGSVVLQYPVTERTGTINIPLNSLKEGIYFYTLNINDNTQVETGRFIIRR